MSAVVVLAIVVATQNVDDQATESMRATAAEAVGGEDSVVVREVEKMSDAEALRVERRVQAQSVARVEWLDAGHTRARVRVHVVETDRWTERVIAFAVVDTSVERGRALGFAVTSMLPEESLAARPHPAAPRAPPATAPAGAGEQSGIAVRLVGIGSTALVSGVAGGMGFGLAGELRVTPTLSARLGAGYRSGTVPQLSGTDKVSYGAVGVAFWPRRPTPARRVAIGIRVDALVIYHQVTDTLPEALTRQAYAWLPGIDALAEVGVSVVGGVEIVTSLGVEAAFYNSPLQVGIADNPDSIEEVGSIPALRAVAEVGIRLSF